MKQLNLTSKPSETKNSKESLTNEQIEEGVRKALNFYHLQCMAMSKGDLEAKRKAKNILKGDAGGQALAAIHLLGLL